MPAADLSGEAVAQRRLPDAPAAFDEHELRLAPIGGGLHVPVEHIEIRVATDDERLLGFLIV